MSRKYLNGYRKSEQSESGFFPGAGPGLVNCATAAILLRLPHLRVFAR
jgi:hypothetical protein